MPFSCVSQPLPVDPRHTSQTGMYRRSWCHLLGHLGSIWLCWGTSVLWGQGLGGEKAGSGRLWLLCPARAGGGGDAASPPARP